MKKTLDKRYPLQAAYLDSIGRRGMEQLFPKYYARRKMKKADMPNSKHKDKLCI